jgi:hypothetical protein
MPDKINNLLCGSLNRHGLRQSVSASMILEDFNKIIAQLFQPDIAKKIQPLYIKNAVLTATCLYSEIASELKLKEPLILEKLKGKVKKIRYLL